MKFVIFMAIIALAQAEIDWSKIKTLHPARLPHPKASRPIVDKTRIIGGQEAKPNSIPNQVALFIQVGFVTYFCGGSLISSNYVLTAGHCVDGNPEYITVILGAHNIRVNEPNQIEIETTEYKIHEEFDPVNLINDLAIIKLPSPVELNENISTIKLPSRSQAGESFEDEIARVSGWGKIHDNSAGISDTLNFVNSDVINNEVCDDWYLGGIEDSHICINGDQGRATCNGDSGGPAVIDGRQIGIISFGVIYGCEEGWPSGLTRLTSFLDWIEKNSDVKIE